LLVRAMITDILLTVERDKQRALARITWEGGATTDHQVTLPKAAVTPPPTMTLSHWSVASPRITPITKSRASSRAKDD
jgi:hypothetical protein